MSRADAKSSALALCNETRCPSSDYPINQGHGGCPDGAVPAACLAFGTLSILDAAFVLQKQNNPVRGLADQWR